MSNCKCIPCSPTSLVPSSKVYYDGSYLSTLGVQANEKLTGIIVKINDYLSSIQPTENKTRVIGGEATATADGSSTDYSFPHTLGGTPSSIVVSPTLEGSSLPFSISYNSGFIYVHYSVAPSQGTLLSWSWIAIKNNVVPPPPEVPGLPYSLPFALNY